ncbi:aminotransferase class IV [Methylobacterium radiodurans]|uniref:Probable branched-chain-amino-acid aminotransferase n=1 Tax=Methylobacterium radiodurans TaxID=2202828 RepID=A0A2U8VW22_9HYPH|nr:aminotransferase class IV [Methylobacterium radiodurans]AWN37306.1 class IV aminotransferase [Methylobacterium radiodurans]
MLWLDGRLCAETVAPFDLTDRGLSLGDAVFDTALALDGRVAFADAHVARLVAGAATLGFAIDPDRVRAAMRALAETGPRLAIRTTATRGTGPRGLKPPAEPRPVLYATAAPSAAALAFAPLSLHVTEIARNETSPIARLKTPGYLDAVLAARDAAAAGFDEALFRNTRGRVACAGTGNLFGILGDRLVTPPLADGVLPGIVRAEVLALAGAAGLVSEERSLALPDLLAADAVFLTNSLRLIAPVRAVGGTAFGSTGHSGLARLVAALTERVAASCGLPAPCVA